MEAYLIELDWPHAEHRLFMAYATSESRAKEMAEQKLVELEDLEVGELDSPASEATLVAHKVDGAPLPPADLLLWVV